MKIVAIMLALLLGATEAGGQTRSPQEETAKATLAAIYPNFTTGYAQGLKEHRFIVVFFKDKSAYTTQMEAEVRKMRSDAKFSAAFLFAEAQLPEDEYGMKAAKQLKVEGVPAVSVLAPTSNMLKELSRFEGVFTFQKMREDIIAAMCKNPKYKDGTNVVDARTAKLLDCPAK
jgi:hypothetical protein